MSQPKKEKEMSGLWHDAREVPELNRFVLIMFSDKSFALDNIVNNKCWLFYLEKQQCYKWLYCDELIEREYPQEFGYEFLRQLETDCFFASQKLATKPAKSKKYQSAAGALLGASLDLSSIIWDFEKK